MHRIDSPGAVANMHGTGKAGFDEGDPIAGVAPTEVSDDFLNAVQEEIANAITLLGLPLLTSATDTRKQLYRVMKWASIKPMLAHLLSEFEECDVGSSGIQMTGVSSHTFTSGLGEGSTVVITGGADGTIRSSEDGGDTWQDSPFTPTDTIRHVMKGGGRFWTLDDGGNVGHCEYANVSTGLTAVATGLGQLLGGCYVTADDWIVVVGASGTIGTGNIGAYTSRTSGTAQNLSAAAVRESGSTRTVCAAGGTTITRSTNGGAAWTVVFTGGTTIKDIFYDYSEEAWVACDAVGLLRSLDDGVTWTRLLTNSLANTGVWSGCGMTVAYASSASAGFGCRLYGYEDVGGASGVVIWRSLADQNLTSHPLYFDYVQGQFWLVTGANDAVYRSKKAPGFIVRALANGLG